VQLRMAAVGLFPMGLVTPPALSGGLAMQAYGRAPLKRDVLASWSGEASTSLKWDMLGLGRLFRATLAAVVEDVDGRRGTCPGAVVWPGLARVGCCGCAHCRLGSADADGGSRQGH
jgi:hypothetical protein